jgi:hypothetical protein
MARAWHAKNPDELGKILAKLAKKYKNVKFKPCFFYNKEGDMIEVYLENVNHYGQWINHDITVLRAQDDNRIVGLSVHGVKKHVR